MSLDKNDFLHLCRLSRLAPDPAAQEEMAQQCSSILAYMDKLSELDTTGVDPLYSPVIHPRRSPRHRRRVIHCSPYRGGKINGRTV